MVVTDTFYSVFTNKCTRCHQGDVFSEKNPYKLRKMFNMNETCSNCGLKYEKEPSFFYGSMYVSYGLTAGWFILLFLLQTYILQWDVFVLIGVYIVWTILTAPLTFRWSRLFWLSFFYPFDKSFKKEKTLQS